MTGCYDWSTTLLYNRNTMKITVRLNQTRNQSCNVFPRGVRAELLMASEYAPYVISTTLHDFSYLETKEIQFNLSKDSSDFSQFVDTDNLVDEQYATLYLIAVSERAEVQIFKFREQRVALSRCYLDSWVVFDIVGSRILLNLVPSLECTLHIVDPQVTDYV